MPASSLIKIALAALAVLLVIGLTIPAVQKARESANSATCSNILRQLALATLEYSDTSKKIPPGMIHWPKDPDTGKPAPYSDTGFIPDPDDPQFAWNNGFSLIMVYLEHENTPWQIDPKYCWFDWKNPSDWHGPNAEAVRHKYALCPSNAQNRNIDLSLLSDALIADGILSAPLPNPFGWDYLLCKGANAAMNLTRSKVPRAARGVFDVGEPCALADITRGTSNVFLIGEGAGGSPRYVARRDYTTLLLPQTQLTRRLLPSSTRDGDRALFRAGGCCKRQTTVTVRSWA
jgi:hypothetical protein